ncbi:ParA family protein [Selenomonas ruminis]|nr:AAA family ATPase [Selenomonas sp. mPRGC5]
MTVNGMADFGLGENALLGELSYEEMQQQYMKMAQRCKSLEQIIEVNDISRLGQLVGKYQNNSKELLKQIAMILPAVEYAPEETKELIKLLDYLEGLHEKLEAYVVKGALPETTLDKTECFGEHRTMRTVSFINFKGGVGKTTVSTNFAYAIFCMLRDSGIRILFIDNDKQGNASDWFEADRQHGTIANVLMGDVPVRKVIQHTRYESIDLIAADTGLIEANALLMQGSKGNEAVILREALQEVAGDYDLCIIDNPPDINMSVINALSFTDDVIIVTFPEKDSLAGAKEIMEHIKQVKKFNKELKLSGILVNAFSAHKTAYQCIDEMKNKHLPVYRTKIHYATQGAKNYLNVARQGKKSIFEVSPSCLIARDIYDFSREYLGIA